MRTCVERVRRGSCACDCMRHSSVRTACMCLKVLPCATHTRPPSPRASPASALIPDPLLPHVLVPCTPMQHAALTPWCKPAWAATLPRTPLPAPHLDNAFAAWPRLPGRVLGPLLLLLLDHPLAGLRLGPLRLPLAPLLLLLLDKPLLLLLDKAGRDCRRRGGRGCRRRLGQRSGRRLRLGRRQRRKGVDPVLIHPPRQLGLLQHVDLRGRGRGRDQGHIAQASQVGWHSRHGKDRARLLLPLRLLLVVVLGGGQAWWKGGAVQLTHECGGSCTPTPSPCLPPPAAHP